MSPPQLRKNTAFRTEALGTRGTKHKAPSGLTRGQGHERRLCRKTPRGRGGEPVRGQCYSVRGSGLRLTLNAGL